MPPFHALWAVMCIRVRACVRVVVLVLVWENFYCFPGIKSWVRVRVGARAMRHS